MVGSHEWVLYCKASVLSCASIAQGETLADRLLPAVVDAAGPFEW